MNLGPSRLYPAHRYLLKNGVNKLDRLLVLNGTIAWKDNRFKQVKLNLRHALREQQQGRCIFCRRMITIERRNALEDIEHYLDKSKPHYKKWTFCPVNLAIACRPCNFVKSTAELGDAAVVTANEYVATMGVFKWIHPYFDDYHQNVEILKGWVYRVRPAAPNQQAAENMIRDLQLDKLATMHAYATEVKGKILRLTELAFKAVKMNNLPRAQALLQASATYQQQVWPDY